MSDERVMIAIDKIEVSKSALRPAQVGTEKFELLVQSIKQKGVQQNVTVAPSGSAEGMYTLINGAQRLEAAKRAGLTKIPALIRNISPLDALIEQAQLNLHQIDTKPAEYGKHLERILREDHDLTEAKLAQMLCQTTAWVATRLGLGRLLPEIQEKVDEGVINLTNAKMLSQMSEDDQREFVGRAVKMPTQEFYDLARKHISESRKAQKEGKAGIVAEFEAIPRLRSKNDVLSEIEKPQAVSALVIDGMSPAEAFKVALRWAVRMDDISINEARDKFNADQEARAARKAEAAAAREAARNAAAAELEAALV